MKKILEIVKDKDGMTEVVLGDFDEMGFKLPDDIEKLLIKELESRLGGDFADEFDPLIKDALKKFNIPDYSD